MTAQKRTIWAGFYSPHGILFGEIPVVDETDSHWFVGSCRLSHNKTRLDKDSMAYHPTRAAAVKQIVRQLEERLVEVRGILRSDEKELKRYRRLQNA